MYLEFGGKLCGSTQKKGAEKSLKTDNNNNSNSNKKQSVRGRAVPRPNARTMNYYDEEITISGPSDGKHLSSMQMERQSSRGGAAAGQRAGARQRHMVSSQPALEMGA